MRRAILGGTFDPPHIAHLIAGEAAYRTLGVDVVTFLPAGSPWQKGDEVITPAVHRRAMTNLAVAGVDYFEADDRETRRAGPTYTFDTVESFDRDELWLIVGADAAAAIRTWHRADELLGSVSVAVAPRPGIDRRAVEAAVGSVAWLDMPEIDLSGTDIRDRARAGKGIRFLVREAVWTYIVDNGLYRSADEVHR